MAAKIPHILSLAIALDGKWWKNILKYKTSDPNSMETHTQRKKTVSKWIYIIQSVIKSIDKKKDGKNLLNTFAMRKKKTKTDRFAMCVFWMILHCCFRNLYFLKIKFSNEHWTYRLLKQVDTPLKHDMWTIHSIQYVTRILWQDKGFVDL